MYKPIARNKITEPQDLRKKFYSLPRQNCLLIYLDLIKKKCQAKARNLMKNNMKRLCMDTPSYASLKF